MKEAVNDHLALVENDMNALRNENVVLESEEDPEFRRCVERELERIRGEMVDIKRIVDNTTQPAT